MHSLAAPCARAHPLYTHDRRQAESLAKQERLFAPRSKTWLRVASVSKRVRAPEQASRASHARTRDHRSWEDAQRARVKCFDAYRAAKGKGKTDLLRDCLIMVMPLSFPPALLMLHSPHVLACIAGVPHSPAAGSRCSCSTSSRTHAPPTRTQNMSLYSRARSWRRPSPPPRCRRVALQDRGRDELDRRPQQAQAQDLSLVSSARGPAPSVTLAGAHPATRAPPSLVPQLRAADQHPPCHHRAVGGSVRGVHRAGDDRAQPVPLLDGLLVGARPQLVGVEPDRQDLLRALERRRLPPEAGKSEHRFPPTSMCLELTRAHSHLAPQLRASFCTFLRSSDNIDEELLSSVAHAMKHQVSVRLSRQLFPRLAHPLVARVLAGRHWWK